MPFLTSRTGFDDEFWTPADDYGASARHTYSSEKEWDVIVVHDNRVINAMVSPGERSDQSTLSYVKVLTRVKA